MLVLWNRCRVAGLTVTEATVRWFEHLTQDVEEIEAFFSAYETAKIDKQAVDSEDLLLKPLQLL
jgi:superfamily I DNA/RNA helicase